MKENFISRFDEEDLGAKVTEFDANKTLFINQFTAEATGEPELVEGARTMSDVFNHFKPSVEVELKDINGGSIVETLHFNEMKDFDVNGGKGNLVMNSKVLSEIKTHADMAGKVRKQMEQSSRLKEILKDAGSKEELKTVLQSMLDELEGKESK